VSSIEVGSAVIPVNGRYAGRPMAVVGVVCEYADVCDGKKRRLDRPKRKKLCHLRLISPEAARLTVDAELTNGKIRRYLAAFRPAQIPDNKHDSTVVTGGIHFAEG